MYIKSFCLYLAELVVINCRAEETSTKDPARWLLSYMYLGSVRAEKESWTRLVIHILSYVGPTKCLGHGFWLETLGKQRGEISFKASVTLRIWTSFPTRPCR